MEKSRRTVYATIPKKSMHKKQTLQQKYRKILGPKQPIVLLKRCEFVRNIFYKCSPQDFLKNYKDNKHATSKLICSTNHVSCESLHAEETVCNDLIHNSKDTHNEPSKKVASKHKKRDIIHGSNNHCVKSSKKHKSTVKGINNDCRLSAVSLDTKKSNNISKTLKLYSQSKTSLETKTSVLQSVSKKIKEDQTQDNDVIVMENVKILRSHNKKKRKRTNDSVHSSSTENMRNIDTMPLQKRFFASNNESPTQNTVDSTVEHAVKDAAVKDAVKHATVDSYKSKKLKDEVSSLFDSNATITTAVAPPFVLLDTLTLQDKYLMPYNKKFKNHTTLDIQKDSAAKDGTLLDTNMTQPSKCLDTVILEEMSSTSCSTSLSEQNIEKHTVPDNNNAQCDAFHYEYGNSGMKQKDLHGSMKEVKLNRYAWCKIFSNVEENNDIRKELETTNRNMKLNNNEEVPELTSTDTPRICVEVLEEDNKSSDVSITEACLTGNQGIFSSEKQNSTDTFGCNTGIECEARIDGEKSPNLEMKTSDSVTQDTSFVLKNANLSTSNMQYDDDDCISLYAESVFNEKYDTEEQDHSLKGASPSFDTQYAMSEKAIDKYYEKNANEFNEVYNHYDDKSKIDFPKAREQLRTPTRDISPMGKDPTEQRNRNQLLRFFRGYCYTKLLQGKCLNRKCYFEHDFLNIMRRCYRKDEKIYFEVIDELILNQCNKFLQHFCLTCVVPGVNVTQLLKTLKRLYDKNITTIEMVYDIIENLIGLKISLKLIVNNLIAIVDSSDVDYVSYMTQIMFYFITAGKIWVTLRPLLTRMNSLKECVIEIIIAESIVTKRYARDIQEKLLHKIDAITLAKVKPELLLEFNKILVQSHVTQVQSISITNSSLSKEIASPSNTHKSEVVRSPTKSRPLSTLVWYDVPFTSKNNSEKRTSSVVLQPIDDVSEPYSKHSRDKFWKFYLDIHGLEEGLKHHDYEHVKKILDAAQAEDVTPFTRACYNILLKKIEHSQYHLQSLASLAVQSGATTTFCKILIDVTINILADLAKRQLWVLAFKLLKIIEFVLYDNNYLFNFDAMVVMLFCAIYLMNRKPMKAFTLLKQTNIIYPHRTMWKVDSNKKDEHIRAQIVTILLDMLCVTSPENAFNLFKHLIENQSNNFQPIDLSSQANTLIASLLLKNDHDLIVNVAKCAITDYCCTLRQKTYRSLICSMVHINLKYALHLYQIAINLDVYSKLQFYPLTALIVKTNWSLEEMHLAVLNIVDQFVTNIGYAIKGITPKNINVYIVFEDLSLGTSEQHSKNLEASIMLMKSVLREKFDPPLSLITKTKNKFYKINSKQLCAHLQSLIQSK
ncbi:uncharacterized protein LOC144471543 [Augochlora pura]